MNKQYGILVDIEKCLGCGICVIACKQENNLPPHAEDVPGTVGIAWNQVAQIVEGKYPNATVEYLYSQCMHCSSPPCVDACPKGAIYKREDGIVIIAESKCNACSDQTGGIKKCISACPYGAIQFNIEKKVVQSCTLCSHRVESGLDPACVRACIGTCLEFGDLNDPGSEISQKIKKLADRVFVLKPEKNTKPSVRYIMPHGMGKNNISRLEKAEKIYGFKKPE